jgi:hypothetical protein
MEPVESCRNCSLPPILTPCTVHKASFASFPLPVIAKHPMAIEFLNSILGPSRQQHDPWFYVGPSSSFQNITSSAPLCTPQLRENPSCKVFLIPHSSAAEATAIEIPPSDSSSHVSGAAHDQVLIFQFQEKFRAITNVRFPSFPSIFCFFLSN